MRGWRWAGQLRHPSAAPLVEPAIYYPLIGLLALIIVTAIVQGARMALAHDPSSITLPSVVVALGALVCAGGAVLQLALWIWARTLSSLGMTVFSLALAVGAAQLACRRLRHHRGKLDGA